MLDIKELERRVDIRKAEIEAGEAKRTELQMKITGFINDIKSRSVIYNLLKNLPVWKELEEIINVS